MSIVPTSTAKKGEVVLQPSFFTSSLFVTPLRDDITALINAFFTAWTRDHARGQPFTVFKAVWTEIGWPWIHFKTLEDRSRDRFLDITMRLLLERTADGEPPFVRVTALFALYTFYMTQPKVPAPRLHVRAHVPIPLDRYEALLKLSATLEDSTLLPFRDQAICILSRLLNDHVFCILPASTQHAENPRQLPREVYVDEALGVLAGNLPSSTSQTKKSKQKKKVGRPSKRETARRAKEDLAALDEWLDSNESVDPQTGNDGIHPPIANSVSGGPLVNPPAQSANDYRTLKLQLLKSLKLEDDPDDSAAVDGPGRSAMVAANQRVLERLRRIDALAAEKGLEVGGAGGTRTGLSRVERAMEEFTQRAGPGSHAGVLSLSEGAGLSDRNK